MALRVILFAVLGAFVFGWIGAVHMLYFYARLEMPVDLARRAQAGWMTVGAIVGAIGGAVQVLHGRRKGNEGL